MRNAYLRARLLVEPSNVTPVWLLPFWRLVKGQAKGDFAAAWKALPSHLPRSVSRPSIEEAAMVLALHRLG